MAKKAGYRSRASLKLKEILKKDILINKGMSVIDLGSFPGGWTQVIKENIENKQRVIFGSGIDGNNLIDVTILHYDKNSNLIQKII